MEMAQDNLTITLLVIFMKLIRAKMQHLACIKNISKICLAIYNSCFSLGFPSYKLLLKHTYIKLVTGLYN